MNMFGFSNQMVCLLKGCDLTCMLSEKIAAEGIRAGLTCNLSFTIYTYLVLTLLIVPKV